MAFNFRDVPLANIPRSKFDRSCTHKTAFYGGYLIPVFVDEALPGDTMELTPSVLARLTTPVVPVLDNLYLDMFWFAVPNRLLWTNWERCMGAQDNPADSIDYHVPVVSNPQAGHTAEELFDYLGVPPGVTGTLDVSALFSRAYNLIWNTWFRDQNLQDSVTVDLDDGPDDAADYVLLKRGKRHDYFTSCLPYPQKGATEAGLESLAGLTGDVIPADATAKPIFQYYNDVSQTTERFDVVRIGTADGPNYRSKGELTGAATQMDASDYAIRWGQTAGDPGLAVDLDQLTLATVNSLRTAFSVQRLLERDARGGTRYVELLLSHFGVTSPDFRLQRPEYLGGGSIPVIFNPVAQTAATSGSNAQGDLAAYAVAGHTGFGFVKSFVEHCVVLGLVAVRADLTYQQGLHRKFSRRDRYDFYWPAFANLGEQSVLSREIFCDGTGDDDDVFGYQERWAEYRYGENRISGVLRSTHATPLDYWHLGQEFAQRPELNAAFIEDAPPIDRVVAVQDEPHIFFDSFFRLFHTRPMPTYSVPGLGDRF